MPQKLSPQIISAAIAGFEQQKIEIDKQIAELRAMLSGGGPAETATITPEVPTGKRKKFSAASRRKMALAQKARWAAIKGTSPAPTLVESPRKKRKFSAAGRAAIVAANKKMWARRRAAAKASTKKPTPAKKKTAVKKAVAKAIATE